MSLFKTKEFKTISIFLIISIAFSFGVSDFVNFWKALSVCFALDAVGYYFMFINVKEIKKEDTTELDKLIIETGSIIEEQGEVIKEYETIFDSQLVELPCVCGGNTFQGLFSPKQENIVECEKCQSTYRVELAYNAVLISEPMNIEDNDILKKIAKVKKPS